jgi:hypothetical protein
MGQNLDLRKFQNPETKEGSKVADAFSYIVSGKKGYKAVIDRKKPAPKCIKCGRGGDPEQKFCPQCGGKMEIPLTNCPQCKKDISETEKFCTECGCKLRD